MVESSVPLSSIVGNAVVLLSDWEKFGLSERVCLHFDWIEAIAATEQPSFSSSSVVTDSSNNKVKEDSKPSAASQQHEHHLRLHPVCGVSALLECTPKDVRLRSDQRRKLKNDIKTFNSQAQSARTVVEQRRRLDDATNMAQQQQQQQELLCCHQPPTLPLKLSSSSQVFFAYETTRIAFCLDASPTLTSTFGFSGRTPKNGIGGCCPLDRLVPMARTFFSSLVKPVPTQTLYRDNTANWRPELAVTVLAVFPRGNKAAEPSSQVLVRDFRVRDVASAELLVEKMEEWALGPVETEIASRLANPAGDLNLLSSYEVGTMPLYTSVLRDLLNAGDAALSTLSSVARPVIVLATAGRSVSCDAIIDIVSDPDRVDVPIVVLDLSSPESHTNAATLPGMSDISKEEKESFHLLSYDPIGALFPLHLSDDTESLHGICKATGGCFYDSALLCEAAKCIAGKVGADSPLFPDHCFSNKRHTILPNAVQWYTLFSLSPLTPIAHSHLGRLATPEYIRHMQGRSEAPSSSKYNIKAPSSSARLTYERQGTLGSANSNDPCRTVNSEKPTSTTSEIPTTLVQQQPKKSQTRFAMYIVNPVRIKGLLLMRIKEGCRARLYGTSTNDPDKVSILFILPLDLGNALHYELSYKALPGHNHMVGFANIKIDLAGEQSFIQTVKNEYLRPVSSSRKRQATLAQRVSMRLCELLRWIRTEDMVQSYLSPLKWSDQLSKQDTPFMKRLGMLTSLQRRRHFRRDEFDCVCLGRMPYDRDDGFLAAFRDVDDGEQELIEAVEAWATQTIQPGKRYIRRLDGDLACYCVVELRPCTVAPRLFTVSVESFGSIDPGVRLSILVSLQQSLDSLKDVGVLSKQMGRFLVSVRVHDPDCIVSDKRKFLESQHQHASWDLVKDPELFPLLVRRRIEIGGFLLLRSSDDHALLAKLSRRRADDVSGNDDEDPGNLVQYQLAILQDKVVVDIHMEAEGGVFSSMSTSPLESLQATFFHEMVRALKKKDQECGLALECRTKLLKAFDSGADDDVGGLPSCVQRLLSYASSTSVKLRFFGSGCVEANEALRSLTHQTLLGSFFGAKVAKLPISSVLDSNHDEEDWFVIEFDKETVCLACLSSVDKIECADQGSWTYRELAFFPFTTGDLYNRRAYVPDDASDDDHISEYMCVSQFSDAVLLAHAQNYSVAAYSALSSSDDVAPVRSIDIHDFTFALKALEFVEVANVVVASGGGDVGMRSKLSTVIGSVVFPIADEIEDCFFYRGTGRDDIFVPLLDDDSNSASLHSGSQEAMADAEDESSRRSASGGESVLQDNADDSFDFDFETSITADSRASAPLFVKLLFDGKPASHLDLDRLEHSVNISVLLSVFSNKRRRPSDPPIELPSTHATAAVELAGLLKAFVAEQTLERLRHYGPEIQADDLRLAKSCLRRARDVVTSTIEVFFYSTKTDSMIPASAPAGCDADVELGSRILMEKLWRNHHHVSFRAYGEGFVVINTEPGVSRLSYWCFVNMNKIRGVITVEVYHPDGLENASSVLNSMHDLLSQSCHTVNQVLLLQRLHQNRVASFLLIPPDDVRHEATATADGPFHAGLFGCPVVFRTSFELFHRCATNPSQVARTVEATVLHIFSISNRRQTFVYKDEDGSVFYMRLLTSGGGVEPDGTIELVVYGVDKPGPSVTRQLTTIIQKRLLQIAVDMLSSVLTKNPIYCWRSPDLSFVRSFENAWNALDKGNPARVSEKNRIYEFPDEELFDPGMILLCLRQNLCGSTYFHKLNTGETKYGDMMDDGSIRLDDFGLVFYYNNAPSKLDPKFQHISTLTSKGAEYAQAAGSGLAIIELSLLSRCGSSLDRVRICSPTKSPLSGMPSQSIRFKKVERETCSRSCIKVKITGTALDTSVIQDWVLLSLNQTLISWAVERHLESIQLGSWVEADNHSEGDAEATKNRDIGLLAPGLPALSSLLLTANATPHPAVLQCELQGVVRSSAVSTVALELLEKIVDNPRSGLCIIRISRGEVSREVDLRWDPKGRKAAIVYDLSGESTSPTIINDAPIDCPEYLCYFFTSEYVGESTDTGVTPPKLFEAVTLSDGSDAEPLQALVEIKRQNPALFRRSSGFVFSIKRNRRWLLAYNWTPHHFKQTVARLRERNAASLAATNQSANGLQLRCLRELSPPPTTVLPFQRKFQRASMTAAELIPQPQQRVDVEPEVAGKKAIRPAMIRRPKLVGRSVEGAALHAVAASRARASSNMFRGGAVAGAASTTRKALPDESSNRTPVRPGGADRGKSSLSAVSEPCGDDDLKKAKQQYNAVVYRKGSLARQHSLQQKALLSLASSFLPAQNERTHPATVASFLLSRTSVAWSNVTELIPLSNAMLSTFLASFAQTLTSWIPGIKLLNVSNNSSTNQMGPVFFSCETKAVRNCRCVTIISTLIFRRAKSTFVRCNGWVVTLPRHPIKPGATNPKRKPPICNDQSLYEKDSAGLDVLVSDSHSVVTLRKLLFDHIASVAERASCDTKLVHVEAMKMVRRIMAQSGLPLQVKVLCSNYKVFECQIFISSYGDRLIDSFQAPSLFDWLSAHAEKRNLISCGPEGLRFELQIVCRGIHSTLFLLCNPAVSDRLVVMVLCRTQGRDLREFMFRDGSNVAVSTLDNIAIEAAGMVYEQLKAAASSLHLNNLWKRISTGRGGHLNTVDSDDIQELLRLGIVKPLSDVVSSTLDSQRLTMIFDSGLGTDWRRCVEMMANDAGFSPSRTIRGDNQSFLYYLNSEDVFLFVELDSEGRKFDVSVVEQSESSSFDGKLVNLAQKLTNFFLHFIWSDIL